MAMDTHAFVRSRMASMKTKPYVEKLDNKGMDMLKKGLQEYADEVAVQFRDLSGYIESSEDTNEELAAALRSLKSLIGTMQKIDKGNAVSPADMQKWFTKFHDTMGTLESPSAGSYTEYQKQQKSDAEKEKRERIEANQHLSELLGDKFETVVVNNAAAGLGVIQGSIFKVGLASFLGPAAPLVSVLDSVFDIDSKMAKLTEKLVSTTETAAKEQAARDDAKADEDRRATSDAKRKKSRDAKAKLTPQAKAKQGVLDSLMSPFKKMGALLGGSGGMVSALTGLVPGLSKMLGFVGNGLKIVGRFAGPLALAVTAGTILWEYRNDIADFIQTSGASELGSDAWGLVTTGMQTIGAWVQDGADLIKESGIIPALGGLAGQSITGWVMGIRLAAGWVSSMWKSLKDTGVPDALVQAEKLGFQAIFGTISGILKWTNGFIQAGSKGEMKKYLSESWDTVKSASTAVLSGVWEDISSFAADKFTKFIVNPMKMAVGALGVGVSGVLTKVLDSLQPMLDKVGLGGMLSGARKLAGDLGSSSNAMVQSAAAPTASAATSVVASTGAAVSAVGSYTGSTAVQKAGTAISQAAPAAGGMVQSAARYVGKLAMPDATIQQVIVDAAKQVGVDPGTLMAMAQAESNFQPGAKASTSSAGGLFQFIDSTWNDMVQRYGKQYGITSKDKMDPRANAVMGALFMRDNQNTLAKAGVTPDAGNLYMAHFLGAGTAARFINAMNANPNADAAAMFPKQAEANRSIFYKGGQAQTLSQVYSLMTSDPKKVSVAKAQAYNQALGVSQGTTSVASAAPVAVAPPTASVSGAVATTAPVAAQARIDPKAPVAAPSTQVASAGPSSGSAAQTGNGMSVDSVPSMVTDEGLLILNSAMVA